jgi:hypothetical protein
VGIVGFVLVKEKISRHKQRQEEAKELLRFFGPYDRMTGFQLQDRIEQVTAGTRKPAPIIYFQLERLVKAGLLCKERITPFPEKFPDIETVRYFLPKS